MISNVALKRNVATTLDVHFRLIVLEMQIIIKYFGSFIAVPSTPFFTIKQSSLELNWDFRNISKLFNLEFTINCFNPSITVDGNVSYPILLLNVQLDCEFWLVHSKT